MDASSSGRGLKNPGGRNTALGFEEQPGGAAASGDKGADEAEDEDEEQAERTVFPARIW